jgi:hypothetical protein
MSFGIMPNHVVQVLKASFSASFRIMDMDAYGQGLTASPAPPPRRLSRVHEPAGAYASTPICIHTHMHSHPYAFTCIFLMLIRCQKAAQSRTPCWRGADVFDFSI